MRLTDLEPQFLRYEKRACEPNVWIDNVFSANPYREYFHRVDTLAEAQGIRFLCPVCFAKNGGNVGTHGVICWSRSRGIPDDVHPGPGRWTLEGTGYDDLTLNGDPPGNARSVLLTGEGVCAWHGFITNGEVT